MSYRCAVDVSISALAAVDDFAYVRRERGFMIIDDVKAVQDSRPTCSFSRSYSRLPRPRSAAIS